MTAKPKAREYRFGRFALQPAERRLFANGEIVNLTPRAFDVLVALVERAGQLVTKNALLDLAWPGLVVEENNLQVQISGLRKVLGPEVIATIPGAGYRFALDLQEPTPPIATAAAPDDPRGVAVAGAAVQPDPLPPLIGRDDDLAALGTLVTRHRLVTITGAGGMGKTRLARHVLREQGDAARDVVWVDLTALTDSALTDSALIASAIASALELQLGSGDQIESLVARIKPLSVLVALDGVERLVDDLAPVVQTLLDRTSRIRLLVTSQMPLKLAQERVYRLGSLAVPETVTSIEDALTYGAVALFVDRARAADRRFSLTDENAATIIDICRNLDGMALALELAAARLPLLGVTQLATALEQRLRVLTAGNRGAPARQQTLRAELEWTFGLLGAAEQVVFRRLAVFAGGFTLPMAQQVVADPGSESELDEWAVIDALGALIDRGLVTTDAAEPPRYRLLESPRAYALDRLVTAGEESDLQRRHALAVLGQLEHIDASCWSGTIRADDAIAALSPELDNARAALAWTLEHAPAIAIALAPPLSFALTPARYLERTRMFDATAAMLTDDLPAELQARWALGCSVNHVGRKASSSIPMARRAIELYRRIGDRSGLYRALGVLCRSDYARQGGMISSAHDALAEMRTLEDPSWPPYLRSMRHMAESSVAATDGAFDAAADALQRALTMSEQAGHGYMVTSHMIRLADMELRAGRVDAAIRLGLDLEARLREPRHHHQLAFARLNLVAAWLARDAVAEARAMSIEGLPLAGPAFLLHVWADYLALLAVLENRPRSCARLLGYSDSVHGTQQLTRQPNESNAAQRAQRLAREQLADTEFDRLKSEGAELTDEAVAALALDNRDR